MTLVCPGCGRGLAKTRLQPGSTQSIPPARLSVSGGVAARQPEGGGSSVLSHSPAHRLLTSYQWRMWAMCSTLVTAKSVACWLAPPPGASCPHPHLLLLLPPPLPIADCSSSLPRHCVQSSRPAGCAPSRALPEPIPHTSPSARCQPQTGSHSPTLPPLLAIPVLVYS